jgi:hypothetical protein
MIGWVDSLCGDWGAHKRWVYADIQQPLPSLMGKIVDEGRYAASHHRPSQHYAEVFSQNSLVISRAIIGIRPDLLATLVVHYVYAEPLVRRPGMVGQLHGKPLSLRTYWRRLHRAHCFIASQLQVPPNACAA